jgi:hypothetical protein
MGLRGEQSPVPGSAGHPLEPGTAGYATAIGLRLLHACVRVLILDQQGPDPLGWRKLPRSVLHWLFEGARHPVNQVPDMLHVPPAAWWSGPLLAMLQAADQGSRWLGPLAGPGRALIRKLGRHVLIGYTHKYESGPVPFRVPDQLARRWRVRIGPAGERVRRVRRRVRRRARARLPRRGGRARGQGA